MADFLLNVHREKNFVQLLIEGVEERISVAFIENILIPADAILYPKVILVQLEMLISLQDSPKWQNSLRPSLVTSHSAGILFI